MDETALLSGAERGRTRPRGFIHAWKPQAETQLVLDQVTDVLDEYRAYLPLTLRQIFYRLVGAHGYAKTERDYKRLGEILNKARRVGIIPMAALRDDGGSREEITTFSSPTDFLETMRHHAENHYRRDRQEGQVWRLLVACEAAGMAPQLARVATEYGVTVISSGGFESLTEKHRLAEEIADSGAPHIVLHIGDHDPSGVHIGLSLSEDVEAFTRSKGGYVEFQRLAVTPEQIEHFGLPTAPPKETDKRAFHGATCQAEAIAPDDLADILRNAIEAHMDLDIYRDVLEREEADRQELVTRLGNN